MFLLPRLRVLGQDRLSKLVMLMIWSRFAVSMLGEVAINTSIAGFSLVALATIAITAVGFLAMPMHLFAKREVKPFYAIVALGALSGALNGQYVPLVTFVVTWSFFVVCALLLLRAYERHGERDVLGCLLAVFALPLAGQALSIILRAPKVGPDGSLSYVGTYGHESVFTLVLLAALLLVALYPWRRPRNAAFAIVLMVASLLFANYRTMVIAAAPLITASLVQITRPGRHALRRFAVIAILLALVLPEVAPRLVGDRFDEIGTLSGGDTDLLKPPEEFTAREKDILSARVYIWASYFYGSVRAELPQFLIGHGPDTRAPGLLVHAHNEFLRLFFEFGVIGLGVWMWVFALQVSNLLRTGHGEMRLPVLAGYASLFLGSLGTAFFNRPEGMIFLAVLCAAAWHVSGRTRL